MRNWLRRNGEDIGTPAAESSAEVPTPEACGDIDPKGMRQARDVIPRALAASSP
jgi:hypothetical protein